MSVRRISVWGAPGAGKSTTAAWLYAQLKMNGHNIEFVREYVKRWAYQKRPIKSFDQVYIMAKQLKDEDDCLRDGVDHIITDSPIGLAYIFAKKFGMPYADVLWLLAEHFEAEYPAFNIFLEKAVDYQTIGRYETEEEAQKFGDEVLEFLQQKYDNLLIIKPQEKERLLEIIEKELTK